MIYSNPDFIILFIVTLASFLIVRSYNIRFYFLLLASIFFYSRSGLEDTLIFFSVIIVSWLATLLADKIPHHKHKFLNFGIILMVLHLFFWKYSSWALQNIQEIFPHFLNGRTINLPLPVGISFFTLQGIAYLVDFGLGDAGFISFREYLLFKSFFPQLVAGPIVRSHQLMPQLKSLATPKPKDLGIGVMLFVSGFFKKLVVADRLAPFIDTIFRSPRVYSRGTLILGIVGYTIQIWADFSGYTDMGRGAARMLGIVIPENFLSPYLSRTPSEFWRRWHITLSEWIRDYIFTPLCFTALPFNRILMALLITMTISGLWHGASWTFLIFGLYHGGLLVMEAYLKKSQLNLWFKKSFNEFGRSILLWMMMSTGVALGCLVFRSQTIRTLRIYLRGVALGSGIQSLPEATGPILWATGFSVVLNLLLYKSFSSGKYWASDIKDHFYPPTLQASLPRIDTRTWGVVCGVGCALVFIAAIFFRNTAKAQAFIYFQF